MINFGTIGVTVSEGFHSLSSRLTGQEAGQIEHGNEDPLPAAHRRRTSNRKEILDLTEDDELELQPAFPASSTQPVSASRPQRYTHIDIEEGALLEPPQRNALTAPSPETLIVKPPAHQAPHRHRRAAERGFEDYKSKSNMSSRKSTSQATSSSRPKPTSITPGGSFSPDDWASTSSSRGSSKKIAMGNPLQAGFDNGFNDFQASNSNSRSRKGKVVMPFNAPRLNTMRSFKDDLAIQQSATNLANAQAGPSTQHLAMRNVPSRNARDRPERDLLHNTGPGMQPDRQRTTGTGNAPNGKGKERAQQEIIELEDSETDSDHPDDVSFAEGIKVWEKENAHRRKPGPRKSEPNTTTSHRGVESASSNSDRRHSVGAMQPDTTCFVNEQPTIPALNVKRSQAMKGKSSNKPAASGTQTLISLPPSGHRQPSTARRTDTLPLATAVSTDKMIAVKMVIIGADSQSTKASNYLKKATLKWPDEFIVIEAPSLTNGELRVRYDDVECIYAPQKNKEGDYLLLYMQSKSISTQTIAEQFPAHFNPDSQTQLRKMIRIFYDAKERKAVHRFVDYARDKKNVEVQLFDAKSYKNFLIMLEVTPSGSPHAESRPSKPISSLQDLMERGRSSTDTETIKRRKPIPRTAGASASNGIASAATFFQNQGSVSSMLQSKPSTRRATALAKQQEPVEIHDEEEPASSDEIPVRPVAKPAGPQEPADKIYLVYPWDKKGGITITYGDLRRLDIDEYLNDTLIEFGLKYIQQEIEARDPELAESIHFFNTYFYKKLTTKNAKNKKGSDGYESVKKWTKNMDIFNKKWVVVPINEYMHWYLGIVANPAAIFLPSNKPSSQVQRKSARGKVVKPESAQDGTPGKAVPENTVLPAEAPKPLFAGSQTENAPIPIKNPSLQDTSGSTSPSSATTSSTAEDEEVAQRARSYVPTSDQSQYVEDSEGERQSFSRASGSEFQKDLLLEQERFLANFEHGAKSSEDQRAQRAESASSLTTQESTPPPQETTIRDMAEGAKQEASDQASAGGMSIAFDSLGGSHSGMHTNLKNYFKQEAIHKKGVDENDVALEHLRAAKAKVPQQKNFTDCGLFVLHFVEQFFQNPQKSAEMIAASIGNKKAATLDWEGEQLHNRRQAMRQRLAELHEEYKPFRQKQEEEEEAERAARHERRRARLQQDPQASKDESAKESKDRQQAEGEEASAMSPGNRPIELDFDDDSSGFGSPEKHSPVRDLHSRDNNENFDSDTAGDSGVSGSTSAEGFSAEAQHHADAENGASRVSPTPERPSKRSRSDAPPSDSSSRIPSSGAAVVEAHGSDETTASSPKMKKKARLDSPTRSDPIDQQPSEQHRTQDRLSIDPDIMKDCNMEPSTAFTSAAYLQPGEMGNTGEGSSELDITKLDSFMRPFAPGLTSGEGSGAPHSNEQQQPLTAGHSTTVEIPTATSSTFTRVPISLDSDEEDDEATNSTSGGQRQVSGGQQSPYF